jgi:hypothetical protein
VEDFPSHGSWRMDWGFGNPNKTAALIALIMTAVWAVSYARRWGFWVALGLFTGFGMDLILTQSRGGLVGAISGCLVALAWAPRPFSPYRSMAVILACAGLFLFGFSVKAESRYVKGLSGTDLSISNRLLIWKEVPLMIHDAPNGWGIGRSGDAYMQWYQPVNRGEDYRTLVNSHLTWLVELDWPGRIVYVSGWIVVFILLWPTRNNRLFSISLGIWVTLAICASFSSVAEARSLWIIPVLALIGVLIVRFRQKSWPETDCWLWGAVVSSSLLGLIWLSGLFAMSPSMVHCLRPGVVTLGTKSPTIWIVAPNRNVLGEHYGHEVRQEFTSNSNLRTEGIGIVSQLKNAPSHQILVFSGAVPPTFNSSNPQKIILIDPKPLTSDTIKVLVANPSIIVLVGEFSQNRAYWSQEAQSYPNIKEELITGSEDYLENWMRPVTEAVQK